MLYFEKDCPRSVIIGLSPEIKYDVNWFDPQNGTWFNPDKPITSDTTGRIILPPFPYKKQRSETDWALKLTLETDARP
jgi:hypothetical protein